MILLPLFSILLQIEMPSRGAMRGISICKYQPGLVGIIFKANVTKTCQTRPRYINNNVGFKNTLRVFVILLLEIKKYSLKANRAHKIKGA